VACHLHFVMAVVNTHNILNVFNIARGSHESLRNLVSGGVLPCGCLVGTYETWARRVITIVDERGHACHDDRHQANAIL
jgi:hypothetical protein